jgi:hypothetical protein
MGVKRMAARMQIRAASLYRSAFRGEGGDFGERSSV